MKKKPIRYIVRKLVLANSVQEAIRKEKDTPVHEVFIDSDQSNILTDAIGYRELSSDGYYSDALKAKTK